MSLPVPQRIGFHVTPDATIEFFKKPGISVFDPRIVVAIINHDGKELLVQLPPMCPQLHTRVYTFVEKMQYFLQNSTIHPVYDPSSNTVSFSRLPRGTRWVIHRKLEELPPKAKILIRSDGCVSYFFINTVTTWDWENQSHSVFSIPGEIAAFAELPDGGLVIADTAGNLYFGTRCSTLEFKITDIFLFNERYLLLNKTTLFDTKNNEVVKQFEGKVRVLSHNFFVVSKELKKFYLDLAGNMLFEDHTSQITPNRLEIEELFCVAEDVLLILYKDSKTIGLWNAETQKLEIWEDEKFWEMLAKVQILKKIDPNTLVFDATSGYTPRMGLYYISEKTFSYFEAGSWGVKAFSTLANGSIIFGTDTRGSGVHLILGRGESTSPDIVNIENQDIHDIQELPNGFVLIQFFNFLMIIKPMSPNIEANVVLDDPEKQSQKYLAEMQDAIKQKHLYQARRFYEKARALKPKETLPCEIFLFFLQRTSYKAQKMRVLLDLHRLAPQNLNLKRSCKRRLFVGELDLSYTEALINKHKDTHLRLASSITATELGNPATDDALQRVKRLMKQGVRVLFGIDAKQLHITFKGQRFQRIHWNGPFGGSSPKDREAFQGTVPLFFKACTQIQTVKDRVHVTLAGDDAYRQLENTLLAGATKAKYRLIRKRVFGSERYPGYVYRATSSATLSFEQREFVFEKTSLPLTKKTFLENAKTLENPQEKEFQIKPDGNDLKPDAYYYECSTDYDSSDYYDSDDDFAPSTSPLQQAVSIQTPMDDDKDVKAVTLLADDLKIADD
ncbi:MAG: hypothetical protein K940chlam8_00755 [Chlamydiae bacterium]|nr:hypothetical protein [Chlamydiota bacterium]